MDPIKAAKLRKDTDDLLDTVSAMVDEFGKVWALIEELHVRTLYIMEKVQLVHREPSPIVGAPSTDTRMTLMALFAQERETFIARIADAQSKLAAFRSGAHPVDPTRDSHTGAASSETESQGQDARRGNGQLVGL